MGTRAKPTTPTTKRAAYYVRVSSEEQTKGYSLAAQQRAIAAYCAQQGWDLVAQYHEPGKSARTEDARKRPVFQQLLADAAAHLFDVVIVHKLDRFARNRRVAFDAFHRLGVAGVGFVSLAENMDHSTPAGQLMLTMLVGMAQFYSDNLSWETKKGKAERKAQGKYNGLLPFGVTTDAAGVPTLDQTERYCDVATRAAIVPAAGLTLAFDLAAAAQTDREIARALNNAGYRTSGNRGANPFTKDSVRVILRNRFYVGDLPDGNGGWLPGKHAALIEPAVFERAEAQRAANTNRPREVSTVRSPWALSGVAVCGGCGGSVTVTHHMTGKRRVRCAGRTQGNDCDEPSCFTSVIEDQIGELLAGFAVPPRDQERLLHVWRHYQSQAVDTAAARIRLRRQLERLKDLYLDGDLDKTEYQTRKAALHDQLAELPAEGDPDSAVGARLAAFLADVSAAWTLATADERNRLARQLFRSVVIVNRTAVAVVPRPDLRPFFALVGVKSDEKECSGGSDGLCSRGCILPAGAIVIAVVPERSPAGRSGRASYQTPRPRALSAADEARIRRAADTRSLRDLAAAYEVSHETIRAILARRDLVPVG